MGTVERDWRIARAWLSNELGGKASDDTRRNGGVGIDELFAGALALDPAARESWLRRECGGDEGLRAGGLSPPRRRRAGGPRRGSWRARRGRHGSQSEDDRAARPRAARRGPRSPSRRRVADAGRERFLEVPTGTATPPHPVAEGPGGHDRLVQAAPETRRGRHGHRLPWPSRTRPVRRRVALKVIKPGMDSEQVIARFEAERQALAMMDHQNIAKVFDAGTTDCGRPFFVMELVRGVPITKYCDDNHLTVRERLALVVPVCKAIQHAHQKGIIHRDLKPTNVLVCLSDSRPVPKVIDFGVAKAVEQRLTEQTMFTQYGQIIGTFEYMSPEQAESSQLVADTRSDIYSLGVMLYELLRGSTPLERQRLRAAGLNEMLKMIKEEEPPKPSMRLSELSRSGSPGRTGHTPQGGIHRTRAG